MSPLIKIAIDSYLSDSEKIDKFLMEYFFNVGVQYDYESSKFHKSSMEIGYGKNERFGNDERIKLQLLGYLNKCFR